MTRTRDPCSDRLAARLTAVVVFPTPPFWFAIVMIRQAPGRGQAGPPDRAARAARAARAMGVSDTGSATTGITTSLSPPPRPRSVAPNPIGSAAAPPGRAVTPAAGPGGGAADGQPRPSGPGGGAMSPGSPPGHGPPGHSARAASRL